ncbi:group III truncated hemoglobin [Poritiphilus flavus]|uniref:Globin n=1 Tax=Poritiphilus flavus TaxID=2697053 RepID=A0A6L9E6V2_9FLAO|nr:group III truncated hemoglobin [Poritiphilus flavus]NAS10485.1 globin [Poritiphilus flavus]
MIQKKEIKTRADVQLLVETFYARIREHEVLGPIFNQIVTDWDSHLDLLTDFWESQLFLIRKYHGDPVKKHQEADDSVGNSITQEHFGLWLNLWFETLEELFEGERVWIAKNRAQKMSTMLYLKIFENRQKRA